jgi:hypothetical protein
MGAILMPVRLGNAFLTYRKSWLLYCQKIGRHLQWHGILTELQAQEPRSLVLNLEVKLIEFIIKLLLGMVDLQTIAVPARKSFVPLPRSKSAWNLRFPSFWKPKSSPTSNSRDILPYSAATLTSTRYTTTTTNSTRRLTVRSLRFADNI